MLRVDWFNTRHLILYEFSWPEHFISHVIRTAVELFSKLLRLSTKYVCTQ